MVAAIAVSSLALGVMHGCAAGNDESNPTTVTTGNPITSATTSSTGQGGQGGSTSPCAMDCSMIGAPPCLQSVCNTGMYQGAIGDCVIVPREEGFDCDDGQYCTIDDACDGEGQCKGGPPNDCGLMPDVCKVVACDEDTDSCIQEPGMDTLPCQDPTNLCIKGSTCSNGQCIGGMLDECFFFPVPDECHVAVCNPTNGMCEAQVGNEGLPCTDPNDLCTINKLCATGVCQGGVPKDCSQLTMGCVLGVCDMPTGNCTTMAVMNGDPCDDLDACTNGETCQGTTCSGGTPVTACVDNDNCCPSTCTAQNDLDCACMTSSITTSFVTNNGFNGNMFDVVALSNLEILSFDVNVDPGAHTIEVYYRPGSHVGFENSMTGWTLVGSAMVTSAGAGQPTPVPIAVGVQIPQGQTYAFYVTTTGTSMSYFNGIAVGNIYAQDAHIQVLEGTGKEYPFLSNFTPRVFSGTVHYEHCGN